MSMTTRYATLASCLGLLTVCGFVGEANASSFALREESAEGLGNAFAGSAAKAYNANTAYYNPAGMTRLDSNEIAGTITWIDPQVTFSGYNTSPLGGNIAGGNGGDNVIKPAAIGSIFAVWNAAPDWRVGMSVAVPYGQRAEYKEDWVGRYQTLATDITDIEIAPTIAYRINDHLSIGGGPRFDYLKARLTSATNLRAIGLGAAQQIGAAAQQAAAGAQQAAAGAAAAAAAGQTATAAQLSAQATQLGAEANALGNAATGISSTAGAWGDGEAIIDGDDFGYGYTLGLLYEVDNNTRVGLNYRSRVYHTVSGNYSTQTPANFGSVVGIVNSISPQQAAALGLLGGSAGAKAGVALPDSVNLGFYHDIDQQWAVMATVEWTDWSVLRQLNVTTDMGQGLVTVPENSRNTWFVSVGANYKATDKLMLHGGLAFDESPVRDSTRTPNLPDSNRYWTAVGASYSLTPAATVHFGYAHLFADKAPITYTSTAPAAGTLVGSYDNSANLFSASFAVKF